MSKKNKKTAQKQSQGAYKHFLNDLQQALYAIKMKVQIADLSNEFKHMLFDYRIIVRNPEAGNEHISSNELKLIGEKAQYYYRNDQIEFNTFQLTCYQLQLIFCYATMVKIQKEKQIKDKTNKDLLDVTDAANKFFQVFCSQYLLDYFKIITQLCSPDKKYYSLNIRAAAILKTNPQKEYVNEVYGFPARKYMIEVNGNKRPAFRMAKPLGNAQHIAWLSTDNSRLGDFYKGNKKELDIYIQSHALKRLNERLDLLDQDAINYALWKNTSSKFEFKTYRNYLLLPFRVFDIKIGYFVANIVDDQLLFSTFLFITHSCTPEGDRLKKISGLEKQDINYWHIDRLSTFVHLKEEKYPGLVQLFSEAGLDDLKELKNKDFDIDSLQEANLDAFAEYINKNKSTASMC